MNDRTLMEQALEKIIVLDGAMGTAIQQYDLNLDHFAGLEGCNEILVETRPDVIGEIHAGYLQAGCDVIETNTFGANRVVLAEYDLEDRVQELNRIAAKLARDTADDFSTAAQPRYVLGSVGPGTRLPSLGHIEFDALVAAFKPQFLGLAEGGADAVCIETCQDILQTKAAFEAARQAFADLKRRVPIFLSVTIETTGTMLLGADVQTALAALRPLGADVIGMNCGTGPAEMVRHVAHLSQFGGRHVFTMPNAGLPVNVDGVLTYDLTPDQFADYVTGFVQDHDIGIVGGCCGTTADHLRRLAQRVERLSPPDRTPYSEPEVSSLYTSVALHQDPPPLIVGERTNANGSKKFRERLLDDDYDGMLEIAREQEKGGGHVLDVSVAYVDRDESADMRRFVPMLAQQVRAPLMIDSTTPDVIESALKLHGGRSLINSINLEDGEERLHIIADLARRFGAALVALTIDETGMAMTTQRKLDVAHRILKLCATHGLDEGDLLFDMLTFTVASGDASTRDSAVQTLKAMETFKKRYPRARTVLGVSNVSFGLKPAARKVINSVFLDLAIQHGLDAAIINARGIVPIHRIPKAQAQAAQRLLLDDQSKGDPLGAYMELFSGDDVSHKTNAPKRAALPPRDRLHAMVVDGSKKGLANTLQALLDENHEPVSIINEMLIPAMKQVGDLFGAGKMQLPFVLQSAEVMKKAVAWLEPHMDRTDSQSLGTLVLATVKGDVHDIGKNLVDIILTNNGYKVVNLGIKIPLEEMLAAVKEHNADALGMSGLLVKSTVIMKENLEEMQRRGVHLPVLLGGAALTRDFVEGTLRNFWGPDVHYCQDAFEGLHVMKKLSGDSPTTGRHESDPDPLSRPGNESRREFSKTDPKPTSKVPHVATGPEIQPVEVPLPPFFGTRQLDEIPLPEVFGFLNETTLFRGQWRYRRGKLSRTEYDTLIRDEVRPMFEGLKRRMLVSGLLKPRAVYGWFRARSEGTLTHVLDEDETILASFDFPRKASAPHHCISDYFRPGNAGPPDLIGLFAVTVGYDVTKEVARLFQEGDYKDYLHLHGLAVESAEAAAEWLHRLMRKELGIDKEDNSSPQAMVRQGYRGSRYSFGYPACPNLEDQKPLFQLLQPERIGVTLSESFQMQPEYSVSVVVLHHPDAKYFNID